uniref:SEA domain-containing protein n=1 Tax=Panagrolaimus sp. JU765 TaxID=591449 RepID=A0AC34QWQ3_9BILA
MRGWHNRDAYGKPLPSAFNMSANRNVKFDNDDDGIFSKQNRSKLILMIMLGIVSLLLLALVIVIIVLFATGVFTTRQAPHFIDPTASPPTAIPPGGDSLVNRTFDVQIFIVDQANPMFDTPTSFEYSQAQSMLQNSLVSMISQSTSRDLQPKIAVQKLANNQTDLQVSFRLSIIIPSKSPINAATIRNLFLSEIRLLENQLNGSEVDRGRISVSMVV